VRQQKQLSRQHDEQPAAAASARDDDAQSITTTSTTTTTLGGGGLCWRCCRSRVSEDRVTPIDRRGTGSVRGRGGRWSSAADCESIGSGSDFACSRGSPRAGRCGTWAASVASSVPVSRQSGPPTAALPDVVALTGGSQPRGDSQEHHPRSTVQLQDDLLPSTADHSAR